jgi:chorismate synthase
VAAGAVAKRFLAAQGLTIRAWTAAAAGINAPDPSEEGFDWDEIELNPLRMPQAEASRKALARLEELRQEGDSAGCRISCLARGMPPGLGEPVFDKLDARIASAMLSLGAVKGVEFGAGFASAESLGSEQNDRPIPAVLPDVATAIPSVPSLHWETNKAGGVLGGISTGMPLCFTVAFKPIPSISKKQQTVDRIGNPRELVIQGRHDVCVAPRAVPVVEAMTALALADFLLLQRSAKLKDLPFLTETLYAGTGRADP